MKTELKIKNFRKLEDITINLRETTFLLGPNSSGKSTFIKALMFLTENLKNSENGFGSRGEILYDFPSKNIYLQCFENIVSNKEINGEVSFHFSCDTNIQLEGRETFMEKYGPEVDYFDEIDKVVYDDKIIAFNNRLRFLSENDEIWFSDKLGIFLKHLPMLETVKNFHKISKTLKFNLDVCFTKSSFRKKLELYFDDCFISISDSPHTLWERSMHSEHTNPLDHIEVIPQMGKNSQIKSLFYYKILTVPQNGFPIRLNEIKEMDINEIFKIFNETEEISLLSSDEKIEIIKKGIFLYYHIQIFIPEVILDKLDITQHFNALRETPKKKYTLVNGKFEIAEYYSILNELPTEIELKGKFGLFGNQDYASSIKKIRMLNLGEEIYKQTSNSQDGYIKIKTSTGEIIDLCDASSGLLQVFPILFFINQFSDGFLGAKKRKLSMEQPELHLHPKLQAKLAEILVGKNIIIETHSEHIIKKVQIMFAKGEVSDENVIINYFDNQNGKTIVKKMEIDDNGFFKEPWPDGFFDEGYELTEELLLATKRN